MASPAEIQAALDVPAPEPVLNMLAKLSADVSVSADELAAKWEAHAMNHKLDLSLSSVKNFRAHLLDERSRRAPAAAPAAAAARATFSAANIAAVASQSGFESAFGAKLEALPSPSTPDAPSAGSRRPAPQQTPGNEPMAVPKRAKFSPESMASPGSGGYAERSNAGQVLVEYKPVSLPPLAPPSSQDGGGDVSRCDVEVLEGHVQRAYRHMHTSPQQRSAALEKRLTELSEAIAEAHGLELARLGVASQQTVTVAGRICCEAAQGKINKTSVVLEGSRDRSGGLRLPLDLSAVPGFALFPGQIVAVEGVNPSGRKLVVSKIFDSVPRPMPATPREQLEAFHRDAQFQDGQPLRMMVASGPFTTTDNLDYLPLDDLAHVVLQTRPDVLVLIGPFVDAAHPQVADNNLGFQADETTTVELTAAELFQLKISSVLATMQGGGLSTKIVLVPALSDVFHEFVYPQPPLDAHELALGPDIVTLSNPATFRVNEVVVGVTSLDTVFHLGGEEVSQRAQDRLGRMCNHMIQQQSYYPLFPAAALPDSPAQLDLAHLDQVGMPATPDVLIVPSRLQQFAKRIGNTLCVNPGALSKGVSGGAFAQIAIHPAPAASPDAAPMSDEAQQEMLPHNVADRAAVSVVRI